LNKSGIIQSLALGNERLFKPHCFLAELVYTNCKRQLFMLAQIAKIFMNGRSQAIRLPKEFRFDTDEVYLIRQGHNIVISEKKTNLG